ncbi:DNA-binding transcriptional regulator, MarR family [Paenibacillus sp. 1_12]|uniref:MarR family winged helix-turn-helix transcriptional regulator n=1 Tax=Paenibacillus sp. 1_12 TaxID=1566278 RepID=UPI0008F1093A|nr:MarR family transcriptional regulator [Paenibacillus sp. 1_12]SFK78031.1 DNA-binding transcriptional regulator, MarR family [Paenibacillus sp. 1_12]
MTTNYNGLEHSVGFIMGMTYRKLSTLLQHRLKPYDITPEQWTVLYQIERTNGMIQKDIAMLSGKDKPTTTRILDHLEEKGFVYKKIGENDRRSFLVHITDKGKSVIEMTTPIEYQATEEIKQCISQDEYDVLMELLLRINNHVNELTDRK